MAHIIDTIRNQTTNESIEQLSKAHFDLVSAISKSKTFTNPSLHWGLETKRLAVDLSSIKNSLITKKSEKFVELINILATVERTIDTLKWCANEYPNLRVDQCHPSTSDDPDGNDIVLVGNDGEVRVRIEVCDVASNKAGQNGKEKSDLKSLGCALCVPLDGVSRFIATSEEFASALNSDNRKWQTYHYYYDAFPVEETTTVMLRIHKK
ncbi:hypothetical protein QF117_13330 [Vibrio sp. YMD68]|uniref:hypothetical protein n=1 Tax=Vibrio sp. YMD68 TaxID=3042300 RepID=UPI00249C167B|nr:hypothetical protein [Vibrio sp. YMD68]WGW01753.1 hypothetical protein QF117_13330 [Vibrio sp. YMD68]